VQVQSEKIITQKVLAGVQTNDIKFWNCSKKVNSHEKYFICQAQPFSHFSTHQQWAN
jgi:hypothetical protein